MQKSLKKKNYSFTKEHLNGKRNLFFSKHQELELGAENLFQYIQFKTSWLPKGQEKYAR